MLHEVLMVSCIKISQKTRIDSVLSTWNRANPRGLTSTLRPVSAQSNNNNFRLNKIGTCPYTKENSKDQDATQLTALLSWRQRDKRIGCFWLQICRQSYFYKQLDVSSLEGQIAVKRGNLATKKNIVKKTSQSALIAWGRRGRSNLPKETLEKKT